MDEQTSFILKLLSISNFLEEQTNLEEGLHEVARLAAQMLKTERCSIMLLSEQVNQAPVKSEPYLRVFTHYGNLPASAYKEITQFNEGIAGYVAATGESLLIKDITQSRFVTAARYLDASGKSLMSTPIILGKQAIGVINVSIPSDKNSFNQQDLELLKLFALFVGKSIYINQLQTILRSKFVEMAVISELADKQAQESITMNPNPTKLAKIVAKSFFRELTKAGFSSNQIIEIATEVLNLLQDNLNKHRKRLSRDELESVND